MISADQAQKIILQLCENDDRDERFVIQSCEASPRGDYWVIRANSEDCVLHGIFERCYVGVNAHLVDVTSGDVEMIVSYQSVDQYLEDKYDLENAAGSHYVLQPAFDKADKVALINLRQKIGLSFRESIELLSSGKCQWLTGKKSVLKHAQNLFREQGIEVVIVLSENVGVAKEIDHKVWYWDAMKAYVRA